MWRETVRYPTFFGLDSRALIPVSIYLLHICVETAVIALVGVAVFVVIQRRGWTPIVLVRAIRCALAGQIRPTVYAPIYRRRCLW